MKVSGFTFLRNASNNGYPFEESIRSILPICDEFVVAVGESDDDTLERVQAIGDPKIRIIQTVWNDVMQDRGFVYGQQKMIAHYNCTGDWAFYLEGDEVLHEDELENIQAEMKAHLNDGTEALYFDFYHFYGCPNQYGIAGYRRAPRVIRNSLRVVSPDGLFFVVLDKNKKGRYPKARFANASIYHYGHVRKRQAMQKKIDLVSKYWSAESSTFSGYGSIDPRELRPFAGNHPAVMNQWLATKAELEFELDPSYQLTVRDRRNRLRFWLEDALGIEMSKKHYTDLDRK